MTQTQTLPDWAEHGGETPGGRPIIHVDETAMYEAFLTEYRDFYEESSPPEWQKADGDLRAEWADALESLDPESPSAYWLEVAYQSMKLDLQLAMRSFYFEIRIQAVDDGRDWAQASHPDGRGVEMAAGGPGGGTEAREHFKRLRGMLPG